MKELGGYPYLEVEITKNGDLRTRGDLDGMTTFVADNSVSDLIVISHGWNNGKSAARALYENLFESVRAVNGNGTADVGDRNLGIVGVLWPSKKFADSDLVPAGAAAGTGGDQSAVVDERLDLFAVALDEPDRQEAIEAARGAIYGLADSAEARRLFADRVRELLSQQHAASDDGSDRFFEADAEELFDRLKAPLLPSVAGDVGGVPGGVVGTLGTGGGAAGVGDWYSGAKAAARRILNYGTYYIMKARAGDVGAGGVSDVVISVKEGVPMTKVHLVGHSFGGRVVTAASKSLGDNGNPKPSSLSLLQAAFSHNGFAESFHSEEDGYFRSVMQGGVVGPVIVTHTPNDRANALAYPLASRLAGQDAAAIGGPGDRFGAIGANGAKHTPEANAGTLLAVGASGYAFDAGCLYNLEASDYIKDHGDIEGREVAYAVLSAVASM